MHSKSLSRFRKRCYDYYENTGIDLIHNCIVSLSSEIARVMKITGRTRRMDYVILNIDHSGNNISVSLSILPINSGTVTLGTLRIEEYANGKWSRVKYWHIDTVGTVNMSKSYIGQTGHTYRARVVVTSGSDNIDKKTSGMTI